MTQLTLDSGALTSFGRFRSHFSYPDALQYNDLIRRILMIDARIIDEISENLNRYLPDSLKTVKGDVENNIRSALQASLERMELVTREDYEVQVAMVAKMQRRLSELEARIDQLESQG
ncbi:MAG: accessory factor UbiK family protein [Granulosicoccaceae bacterium]